MERSNGSVPDGSLGISDGSKVSSKGSNVSSEGSNVSSEGYKLSSNRTMSSVCSLWEVLTFKDAHTRNKTSAQPQIQSLFI
jgi:hypothetical protein